MDEGQKIIQDVNSELEDIYFAALNPSLHVVSELIVNKIYKKVKADNVRIRFVDYSGKYLVPEAISGIFKDDYLMAVRTFDECIVGLAATRMKLQRVNNLQNNEYFKKFLMEINEKSHSKPKGNKWEAYATALKSLKSEIAVPVILGKMLDQCDSEDGTGSREITDISDFDKDMLIGVINANSTIFPFSEDDEKDLIKFGFDLSLAVFNRRSKLLEKLHEIEHDLMSVFSRDEVARKIAEGVRFFFEGSIPNIYLFDEEREGNPFQFITAAGTPEEQKLGNFFPRWKEDANNPGVGETVIQTWRKYKEAFIVIEDVLNDPRAGKHARDLGVKTVCCVPLAFKGEIVGVLYLHFTDKIHFFTREDRKILQLFALSAAIAIKNVTGSPSSFADLYGNEILEYIDNYPEDENNKILVELKLFVTELKNSRGRNEIVKTIVERMSKIGRKLEMPEKLFSIFSQFQKYEELILFNIPKYRDHFIHMFFVFSIGFLIINEWKRKEITFIKADDPKDFHNWIKSWYICATMHDVAYPVSDVEKWIPQFPADTLDLPYKIRASFDWSPFIIPVGMSKSIEIISSRFAEILNGSDGEEKKGDFRQWFHQQLLEIHDHGALGALAIMNLKWEDTHQKNSIDAALAVSLHNYVKAKDAPLGQLRIKDFPLAFLLTYCDVVQEWGRPTGNVNTDSNFDEIQRKIFFNELNVDNVEDNSTILSLIYSPENSQRLEDIKTNERLISQKILENIAIYKKSWSCANLHHIFKIVVQNSQKEICHYTIP